MTADGPLRLEEARRLFSPEGVHLNTASYGLPPLPSWEAMQVALDEWRHGRTSFEGWDESVGASRAAWARLVGVDVGDVAVGPQVSPFVGLVAASLPRGARVLCAEEDFTSVVFPWLAQDLQVDFAPLDRLADAVTPSTDLVAVSAVQSRDGRLADLDALASCGARTFIDATQAVGWLPFDASRFDYVVCGGYKWLLAPRGTAFFFARDRSALVPAAAGWYAAEVPMGNLYGPPLRLAESARALDISPAWHNWVGQAPSLALLERLGVEAIHAHDLGLARRFARGLGLPEGDSAIVSLDLPEEAADRLDAARVRAAGRGGLMRFSFHLYNTEADVDAALEALAV